jgi:putative phosphoesterase
LTREHSTAHHGSHLTDPREIDTVKISILSDSHDHTSRLATAARESLDHGVEAFLHCGDLVDAATLAELVRLGKPVYLVHGNNSGDLNALRAMADREGRVLRYFGAEADFHLAGRRVFLSHYPHRAHAMAATGCWDLLCCGHSHTTEITRVRHSSGEAVVLNPGTVAGIGGPATYAVGDLETLRFEIRPVPDRRSHTPVLDHPGVHTP